MARRLFAETTRDSTIQSDQPKNVRKSARIRNNLQYTRYLHLLQRSQWRWNHHQKRDRYFVLAPFRGFVPGDAQATIDGFPNHRFIDSQSSAQTTDEYLTGFERQISNDISIGATYTHRKYNNLEDVYIPGVTSNDFTCAPLLP